MDPTAPISPPEFDIFSLLCKMKEEYFIGQAAGGTLLVLTLVTSIAAWCKGRTKVYKVQDPLPSMIVTSEDLPLPHPIFEPRSSTPELGPKDSWV